MGGVSAAGISNLVTKPPWDEGQEGLYSGRAILNEDLMWRL